MEQKIDMLIEMMAGMNERMVSMDEKMASMDERMTGMQQDITSLKSTVTQIDNRLISVESHVRWTNQQVVKISEELTSTQNIKKIFSEDTLRAVEAV